MNRSGFQIAHSFAATSLCLLLAASLASAEDSGEVCESKPTGPISVIVLQSASAVHELGGALRGDILLKDKTTVIFQDGRIISSDVGKVGDHLNSLGWGERPISLVSSLPARRARPRGGSS